MFKGKAFAIVRAHREKKIIKIIIIRTINARLHVEDTQNTKSIGIEWDDFIYLFFPAHVESRKAIGPQTIWPSQMP